MDLGRWKTSKPQKITAANFPLATIANTTVRNILSAAPQEMLADCVNMSMEENTVIEQLRHFAPLEYRYQLDDVLTLLWPHTEATVICLADALSDEDSDVRLLSVQILGLMETKAHPALPAMIRALDDKCRIVRIAALEPVASFGTQAIDAIPILETWLEQTEDEFSSVIAAGHIPRIDAHRTSEMSVLLEQAISSNGAVTQHAQCLLSELKSPTNHGKTIPEHRNPTLTVEQLVMLLREPHPDHDFFEAELNPYDQQKLRADYSPDAIQHVALCELVEQRAREAVSDILFLIKSPTTTEDVRLHATQAVFDITAIRV